MDRGSVLDQHGRGGGGVCSDTQLIGKREKLHGCQIRVERRDGKTLCAWPDLNCVM